MSETVKGGADVNAAAGPAITISDIHAQLVALRRAGMLSPEGRRMLAQAEAVEAAKGEMEAVQRRLKARLEEIDGEAAEERRKMQ